MNRLEVTDLRTYFFLDEGVVKAVDGVSLSVGEKETVGVIGESGCGKTIMSQSILRLVTAPGEIVSGSAALTRKDGSTVDVFALDPGSAELRSLRSNEISIVFQEPMASFSPVHTVGRQIAEVVELHRPAMSKRDVHDSVVELLDRVGISNPRQRFAEYPHQLSGGMRQRAMIAMALSCSPRIMIADEPTTALDVTIQAQILDLVRELQEERDMSVVYITHNMAVIAEQADRVYVMYLGKVVESATTVELFTNPQHPYTQRLLRSVPRPGSRVDRLETIDGSVPTPIGLPQQCGFAPRCAVAMAGTCDAAVPALAETSPGHFVRCFRHSEQTEPKDEWAHV